MVLILGVGKERGGVVFEVKGPIRNDNRVRALPRLGCHVRIGFY